MREEESNWFSRWEEELPSPDDLIPLSQTLITPDLALAFDIRSSAAGNTLHHHHHHNHHHQSQSSPQLHHHNHQQQSTSSAPQQLPPQPNSSEFDSSSADLGGGMGGGGGGSGGGGEEPARTLKRPRLVWTPQLHKRFVDAVAHLGIKNAVPKTIMQLMSVDGLTRENVASHLQKYRLYLKRMQSLNNGGPGGGPGSGPGGSGDPATDHLFASSPVPAHFLHPAAAAGGGSGGGGGGYMPVAALQHHHQQQLAAAAVAAAGAGVGHTHQIQAQYHHPHHSRQMGLFGSEHPFLTRQAQLGPNRNGIIVQNSGGFVEDLESGTANNNGRKVLTLFPTGGD